MNLRVSLTALGATVASVLCVLCGTDHATLDDEGSPCAVLNDECPRCTLPGPKEECQTAVAAADDVQCIAVLDDPGVVDSCGSDGGVDAEVDAASEGLAPSCPTQASANGLCECSPPCATACPEGLCDLTCEPAAADGGDAGEACAPSCSGGHCTFHCAAGATCQASCSGGGCVFVCAAGSTCENTCTGGGCTFQCQENAVCSDSCAVDAGCVGL